MRLCNIQLKCAMLVVMMLVVVTNYFNFSSQKISSIDNMNSRLPSTGPFALVNKANGSGHICDNLLFVNTPVVAFKMSSDYDSMKPIFNNVIAECGFVEASDGHSGRIPLQTLALHYFASRPFVHTVCETGFNAGHSSFNFLTANPQVVVHSFDISSHGYSKRIAKKLSEMFPGRFFYHSGDSQKTIPQFIAENPQVNCSLINVDGGHTFEIAYADVTNFASVADVNNGAIITFDDYPSRTNGAAWDRAKQLGYIEEVAYCLFPRRGPLKFAYGFVFGSVIRRPDISKNLTTLSSAT
jgi:Methyltransferase domain